MLGIHVSESTAEGWFGKGIAHAILSITIIVVVILGISTGIFFAGRAIGGTTNTPVVTNPNPSIPTAPEPTSPTPIEPTPSQTPPATTSEPTSTGVIVITAEQLVKDLLANPNKYKKGDVLQISGTITTKIDGFPAGHTYLYYYSPRGADNPSPDYSFNVTLNGLWDNSKTTEGAKVTVLGTFEQWARFPEGGGIALIEVIEVTPAK